MVSTVGGARLAVDLGEDSSVVVTPHQERARTRRLLEQLRGARQSLARGLAMTLEQPDTPPERLAMELQQAFSLYNSVFLRYHGASRPFLVSDSGGCVVVACGRGRMVLRRDLADTEGWRGAPGRGGWVSTPLGLRGPWLVRYLMGWPGLQVPDREPPPLNETLMELRDLMHEPCSSSLLRLCHLRRVHISPVVHNYIQDLLLSWPQEFQDDLRRLQERSVVEEGMAAQRQQMQADVEALLARCSAQHPGDAEAMAPQLQGLLSYYAQWWNDAVDDRAHLIATPWRHADSAAVHVFDVRDETHTHVTWEGERGWVVQPTYQNVHHSLPEVLMRDAPVLEWDDWAEDEGLLWDTSPGLVASGEP